MMTEHDLRMAIAYAKNGIIQDDIGANDALAAALEEIAVAAPNPPDALIAAAYSAFGSMTDDGIDLRP